MQRQRCCLIVLLAVGIFCGAKTMQAAEPRKPNVIVLVADDLGYGDIGLHGSKEIATPHIDSLSA